MSGPVTTPIAVVGVLYDKLGRVIYPGVTLAGEATVGAAPPPGEGKPPGIWGGGNEPFPTPPINLPPVDAHPEHPIVLPPDPPTEPPTEPPTNPPSVQWVWGYNPTLNQWLRVYVPGPGQPGPKG